MSGLADDAAMRAQLKKLLTFALCRDIIVVLAVLRKKWDGDNECKNKKDDNNFMLVCYPAAGCVLHFYSPAVSMVDE